LGFQNFFQAAGIECRFDSDSIGLTRPEQQLEQPCEFSDIKLFRFLIDDFHSSTAAQISSRQSQKAAALLPDPDAVDIR
jgi:hypothetical protein